MKSEESRLYKVRGYTIIPVTSCPHGALFMHGDDGTEVTADQYRPTLHENNPFVLLCHMCSFVCRLSSLSRRTKA